VCIADHGYRSEHVIASFLCEAILCSDQKRNCVARRTHFDNNKENSVAGKVEKAKKEYKKVVQNKKVVRKQPNAIVRYFSETIGELRKVSWPTRKDAISLTMIVLIVTFSMSSILGFLDFIFTKLFALVFA